MQQDIKAGHGGHHGADHAAHNAHLAHESHLASEVAEIGGHRAAHASHYTKHLQASKTMMSEHNAMAGELKKMNKTIDTLQRVMNNGGGDKIAANLAKLQEAHAVAKTAFDEERAVVASASAFVQANASAGTGMAAKASLALGNAAKALEAALASSKMGRGVLKTGKVVSHPAFARSLQVFGSLMSGIHGWADSNATTTGGRAANAAIDGAGGALMMSNPLVAGVDLLTPKGYKLSEVLHGGAGAISGIGEAALTGDTRSMDTFHERSKQGDYGKVMQASSEAGDYWAEHGILDGIKKLWD
jgi:hypothetical protein